MLNNFLNFSPNKSWDIFCLCYVENFFGQVWGDGSVVLPHKDFIWVWIPGTHREREEQQHVLLIQPSMRQTQSLESIGQLDLWVQWESLSQKYCWAGEMTTGKDACCWSLEIWVTSWKPMVGRETRLYMCVLWCASIYAQIVNMKNLF